MKHYDIALGKLGLREIVGPVHNEEVVAMFAKVGHSWVKDDETAWCAAFVGWALEMAGEKSTGKLNARSYVSWGEPVTPAQAQKGDVITFPRGKSWQGHVGFVSRLLPNGKVEVLSGNQSNAVTLKAYVLSDALAVRRLPAKAKSKAAPVAAGAAVSGIAGVTALEGNPVAQTAILVACVAILALIIWKVRK